MKNLTDLFHHHLKDLYSAEKQLFEAMPNIIKAATNPKLTKELEKHQDQTKQHLDIITKLCDDMDVNPGNSKCKAMAGLIKEGEDISKVKAVDDVKDAGIIAAMQRIEHYEISGYGTARQYAETLGLKAAEKKLNRILKQEQKEDTRLNQLAIKTINKKAIQS